jgi:hypothetical protein
MIDSKLIQTGIDYLRGIFPPQQSEVFGRTCFKDSFTLSIEEGEKGVKIIYQSASSSLTAKQADELKKLMKAEEVVILK